jgi:hypothetical protein
MPSYNIEVSVDLDFESECSKCGASLNSEIRIRRGIQYLEVEPCSDCLVEAKDGGYDKGYKDGCVDGEAEGYHNGYNEGISEAKPE